MSAIVFVLAFCIVAVLVYMGRYSGRLRVEQVRHIAAPPHLVYAQVAELRNWQAWNPWLEHEPGLPMSFEGNACRWSSPRIGSGAIRQRRLQAPALVEQALDFAQPFRFRGRARWQFIERDGGTEVRWTLRGRVGFTMRAFAPTVQGMLAFDFRHGLDRLAALIENRPAAALSLDYLGPQEQAAQRYVFLPYHGRLAGLQEALPRGVAQLREQLAAAGLPSDGRALAVYVKTQIKLRTTECRIGVVIPEGVEAGALETRELPAHRAFVARARGRLDQLELAWYHTMQRARVDQLQPDLRITPFEHYLTGPAPGDDNLVALHLALRPAALPVR